MSRAFDFEAVTRGPNRLRLWCYHPPSQAQPLRSGFIDAQVTLTRSRMEARCQVGHISGTAAGGMECLGTSTKPMIFSPLLVCCLMRSFQPKHPPRLARINPLSTNFCSSAPRQEQPRRRVSRNISLGVTANIHPSQFFPMERGESGPHQVARKERFLVASGKPVQPHQDLPDDFILEPGKDVLSWAL